MFEHFFKLAYIINKQSFECLNEGGNYAKRPL